MMRLARKSLQLELSSFMKLFSAKGSMNITNSAYHQNRMKIKPDLFKGLLKRLNEDFYTDNEERVKLWNGFRLLACDGSLLTLPSTEELRKQYSTYTNQYATKIVQARCSLLYDLSNRLVIDGALAPKSVGERELASQHLAHCRSGDLLIYDRGYPSLEWVYAHHNSNIDFLMRCKHAFNQHTKDFLDTDKDSIIIELKPAKSKRKGTLKNASVSVRLVKVLIDSGEVEILMTSLKDEHQYPVSIFKELYFKRWGIETFYDVLKNIIQVEKFTGYSEVAIQQDFYCALFVANIQSLLVSELEQEVDEKCSGRKYEYKINTNLSFGYLQQEIIHIFLSPNPALIEQKLKKLLLENLVPIRPGRENKRNKDKYRTRKKPPLFTNFKTTL